jgi:glucuronokinase
MIIKQKAYPRAGLAGNPSDIFHGKTISLVFDTFCAEVILYETPKLNIVPGARDRSLFSSLIELVDYRKQFGYYGGIRLIEACIVRFYDFCLDHKIELDRRNFTLEYYSDVPFGIGLSGSTAIIKAVFSALMEFYGLTEKDIPKPIQARLILEAESSELGISAGPQDRVAAVYGGLVHMDFTEEAYAANKGLHGNYENMDPALLPLLFIAYTEKLSENSGKVHNIMRYRAKEEHDKKVLEIMRKKARIVDVVKALLLKGEKEKLGPIMSEDFALRKEIYDISPVNQQLVDIAEHRKLPL